MIPPSLPPPSNSTCWSYWDPPLIEENQTTIAIPKDKKGCDYKPCEAAVCACDSYCCDIAWDSSCRGFNINKKTNGKSKKDNPFTSGCSASILCCEPQTSHLSATHNKENEEIITSIKDIKKIIKPSSSPSKNTYLISDNDYDMMSSSTNFPTAIIKIERESQINDDETELITNNDNDNNLMNERYSKSPKAIDVNDNIIETNYPTRMPFNDNDIIIATKMPVSKIPQNPSIVEKITKMPNNKGTKMPVTAIPTNDQQELLLLTNNNNNDNKVCNTMIPPSNPPLTNSTCWSYFDNNPKSISNTSTAVTTITNNNNETRIIIQKGCDYKPCENAVCKCDPYCCNIAWDLSCRGHGYYDYNDHYFMDISNCSASYLCCEDHGVHTISPSSSSLATTIKPTNILYTDSPTTVTTNLPTKIPQQIQVSSTMKPSILFTIHNVTTATSQSPTSSSTSIIHKDSSVTVLPTNVPTTTSIKDYNTMSISPTIQSTLQSTIRLTIESTTQSTLTIDNTTIIPEKENNNNNTKKGSYSQEQIDSHRKIIIQPIRVIGIILLIITLIVFSSMCIVQNYDKYTNNGNTSDESNLNTPAGIEEMLNNSRSFNIT